MLVANSNYFNKEKKGKYGLEAKCKKCKKQYYEQNKERITESQKQYREQNKERIAESQKQYRETPQGQVAAFNSGSRRRVREQKQGNGITKEQWLECMKFFNWKCAYSGITLSKENRHLDHINPLSKGGVNEIWNLVPMYNSYNFSKNNKNMLEWYKEQEFYSEERLQKIYEWQEYARKKYHLKEAQ